MDWKALDDKHADSPWKEYPSEYCRDDIKPSRDDLEFKTQTTDDPNVQESMHPWCKSCYGLYSQICETVAKKFGIPSHITKLDRWKNTDLSSAVDRIIEELINYPVVSMIKELNPLLKVLCDCIKTRWYPHCKCHFHSDKTNPSLVKSNLLHMKQITFLCTNVARLYEMYDTMATNYKKYSKGRLPEGIKDFTTEEEQVFNVCKHQIVKYSSLESKYADVLTTSTPKPNTKRYRRSRSPDRDKDLVKSGY